MWEPCQCAPCEPCRKKQKLDACLEEISKQFVSIEVCELKRARDVFQNVFDRLKHKMQEKSNYFKKYCTEVLRGGSVYDGTKVAHMDEFDLDIVIRLPIDYNQIILENEKPGFLLLKIDALDNLDKQPNWERDHKEIRDWRDSEKYLLQNKMRQWLQGVMARAINDLGEQVDVNGTVYLVTYKESGPAYTLQIRNNWGDEQFQLDVDLVPVVRFQHPRWPDGYSRPKQIAGSQIRDWLVVPKPNKAIQDSTLKNRCWRLSFQDYEREMMKGNQKLKNTIRLIKKLRDVLDLKSIASYYIKTLFLWEIKEGEDENFCSNRISITFGEMVEKLYRAVKDRKVMYFWHPDHNLLKDVSRTSLQTYENKLKRVLGAIYSDDCKTIIDSLLTTNEAMKFKSSEFYKKSFKPTSLWDEGPIRVSLQPPQPFQIKNKNDVATLASTSSAWQKWKRSFEIFYEACELSKKETKVQINILLHIIGHKCQDIYDKFDEDFETVEQLLQKFDDVFLPKQNVTAERHRFFSRNQKDSESIKQYMTELKKLAIKCKFKEGDDLVRDRLICGLKNTVLRERILAEVDLTPTKMIG